jgi:carbonic anhydrase
MQQITDLFRNNRAWAKDMKARDADFFSRLSRQQTPDYLWIGCSDSRVPANTIVGLQSGEVFVHRNLANLIKQADMNCLSVIQFAIDVLKVRHIIICGHYGCSGVRAAMEGERLGLSDNWLAQICTIRRKYDERLATVHNSKERHDLLCELNVIEQVMNACETTVVRDAWQRGQSLTVHGWIYGIEDGLLHDLQISTSAPNEVAS